MNTHQFFRVADSTRLIDPWDQYSARLDAQDRLRNMKWHEFLIERLHALVTEVNITDEERRRLYDRYVELYWGAVGVHPRFRVALRELLESIAESGDRSVYDVLDKSRQRAFSSPLGTSPRSADGNRDDANVTVASEKDLGFPTSD